MSDVENVMARRRIDELEANGLMIYIAAKEAGVSLVPDDAKTKQFLAKQVIRPMAARLEPRVGAADGWWDELATQRIPRLVNDLKAHFG